MSLRCYFNLDSLLYPTGEPQKLVSIVDDRADSALCRLKAGKFTPNDWCAHSVVLTASNLRLHWDDEICEVYVEVSESGTSYRRDLFLEKLAMEQTRTILFYTVRESWRGKQLPARYEIDNDGLVAVASVKRQGETVSVAISGKSRDGVLGLLKDIEEFGHDVVSVKCTKYQLLDGAEIPK